MLAGTISVQIWIHHHPLDALGIVLGCLIVLCVKLGADLALSFIGGIIGLDGTANKPSHHTAKNRAEARLPTAGER